MIGWIFNAEYFFFFFFFFFVESQVNQYKKYQSFYRQIQSISALNIHPIILVLIAIYKIIHFN